MNMIKTVSAFSCVLVLITGCDSATVQPGQNSGQNGMSDTVGVTGIDDPSLEAYPDADVLAVTEIQSIDADGNAKGGLFDDPSSPLSKQTIYFEYDSSQVKQEYVSVINAHASYLINHPEQKIALQGHADERGTREYNIALAEQRSKSVARLMQMQGVTLRQLEVISYGEEKPAVAGNNSDAWQQNRRVELMYLN